jgi:uncharacterized protein YbjQ (UPF0145 family)
MKIRQAMALVAALVLAACGHWSTSSVERPATAPGNLAPTSAAQITVTENDITDRTYVSLGDISVTVRKATLFDSDPTRDKVNDALREEAAKLGADAVVLARYGTVGIGLVSWGQMDGQGRAVSFRR